MRGVQSKITLWRKRLNADTKLYEYERVVLPMLCKWNDTTVRSVSTGQAVVIQTVRIMIPYVPDFGLDIKQGDFMALGIIETEMSNNAPNRTSDLKAILAPNFIEVQTVLDYTRESRGKHYEVNGVS